MSNHHKVEKTQAELSALFQQDLATGVGRSVKHDSAAKHVSGEAVYIDDRLEFPNQLHVYARLSDRAHAKILSIDTAPCYAFEGVRIVITHKDIPGLKDIGPLLPGDPLLAIDDVQFVGQPVLAVAARDLETARQAAMAAVIEYEDWSRSWTWSKPCANATSSSTATPTSAATRPRPWPAPSIACRARCTSAARNTSTWRPRFPR